MFGKPQMHVVRYYCLNSSFQYSERVKVFSSLFEAIDWFRYLSNLPHVYDLTLSSNTINY